MQAVFDGHNDVLLRLWQNARKGADPVREFVDGIGEGHIDAPRAKAGGLIGGISAIYVPSGDLVLQPREELVGLRREVSARGGVRRQGARLL